MSLKKVLSNPLILQSLWSMIARFTGVALNFIVILIITNHLPKIATGDLLLLMQFVTGVALFSRLGIDQLLIKEVASSHKSHLNFQSDYIKNSYKAVLVLSTIIIVLWLLVSPYVRTHFFENGSANTITLNDLMLAGSGVLFFNLIILNSTYLKAIKKTFAGVLSQNALPAITLLFFIGLFWGSFSQGQYYINLYTASNILAGIIAIIMTAYYLKKQTAFKEADSKENIEYEKAPDVIGVIKKSIPLAPVSIFSFLMLFADTLMVGWFLTNDQVADYNIAARISFVILFFLQALEATIYPRLLNIYKQNSKKLITFFWQSTTLVISVVLSVTLVMYLLSDWLLMAFGDSYIAAAYAFKLLLLAQLLRSASLTFSFMFIIREQIRYLNIVLVVALIVNLILNIILIKLYGIEGAALATLIANGVLLLLVFSFFYMKKLLQNISEDKQLEQGETI